MIIGSGLTGICAVDRLVDELIEMSETGEGTKFTIVVLEARDFCSGATGELFHVLSRWRIFPYSSVFV